MNEMTKKVLDLFEEINKIPRKSKNEKEISAWLLKWGQDHGFETERDEVENVLMRVPATKGHEDKPVLVLQGHMDMVCEKTPDSDHDFAKDPIKHVVDGEWLKADRTTLGADNGIALALAMIIATDESVEHPPLELLFTVDEETGLTGANALQPGWLKGKVLLNIDSEDEGVMTIGCAGGKDSHIELPLELEKAPEGMMFRKIKVGGLKGGHSGVDINQPRANANILLTRVISAMAANTELRIVHFEGGSAHNAISRDAYAVISTDQDRADIIHRVAAELKEEFKFEKNLEVVVEEAEKKDEVLTKEFTSKIIDLMLAMPHGIAAMSTDIEGLVETSNNFATVRMEDGLFKILTSQRSSVMSARDAITEKIEAVGRLAGAKVESGNGYPAWQPDMDSKLLEKCKKVYVELYGKEPVVEIIHAGLECGIIGSKNEGMDMVSFGPTIKNPHSPDEMMHLPSLDKIWDFMIALIKSYL